MIAPIDRRSVSPDPDEQPASVGALHASIVSKDGTVKICGGGQSRGRIDVTLLNEDGSTTRDVAMVDFQWLDKPWLKPEIRTALLAQAKQSEFFGTKGVASKLKKLFTGGK